MEEVYSFCDALATELAGWKSRLNEVTQRFDRMSTGEKSNVVDQVRDLHIILEEFEDRIGRLKSSCPTEWGPENRDLSKDNEPKTNWEEVWGHPPAGDFGG